MKTATPTAAEQRLCVRCGRLRPLAETAIDSIGGTVGLPRAAWRFRCLDEDTCRRQVRHSTRGRMRRLLTAFVGQWGEA
jgi:hypothetical protein